MSDQRSTARRPRRRRSAPLPVAASGAVRGRTLEHATAAACAARPRALVAALLLRAGMPSGVTRRSRDLLRRRPPSPSPTGPAEITLAFAGDVHFTERTLALLDNPATAFGPVADAASPRRTSRWSTWRPRSPTGARRSRRQFHFRAPATAYDAVKAAGRRRGVASANNHALDYGRVGLPTPSTARGRGRYAGRRGRAERRRGVRALAHHGQGRPDRVPRLQPDRTSSRRAGRPRTTAPGIAMAFDTARAVARRVKAAQGGRPTSSSSSCTGGTECNSAPTAQQKTFAEALADAGADLIIGAHAHVLQGDGWLGQTFVAYGLSQLPLVVQRRRSNDTGVLRVTLPGTDDHQDRVPARLHRPHDRPADPVHRRGGGADRRRSTPACAGAPASPTRPHA